MSLPTGTLRYWVSTMAIKDSDVKACLVVLHHQGVLKSGYAYLDTDRAHTMNTSQGSFAAYWNVLSFKRIGLESSSMLTAKEMVVSID